MRRAPRGEAVANNGAAGKAKPFCHPASCVMEE
jgi:hypothetical protein